MTLTCEKCGSHCQMISSTQWKCEKCGVFEVPKATVNLDYYAEPFWAEVFIENKRGDFNKKFEEGFQTLEEAKSWAKKHALSSKTSSWCIESGGEIVLSGG